MEKTEILIKEKLALPQLNQRVKLEKEFLQDTEKAKVINCPSNFIVWFYSKYKIQFKNHHIYRVIDGLYQEL